jgi:glyoxylase-like metal-dependent hydrolase (beta-lactamase superfamily II)
LAHASYLVADEESQTAAVVDPQRDIDLYLADAEAYGVAIRHVLLTHFHADFVAGHLELRNRAGAQIYLGSRAKAEYAFTPLADGPSWGLASGCILETPDIRPSRSPPRLRRKRDRDKPQAVLTEIRCLLGMGRPDLRAALGYSAANRRPALRFSAHETVDVAG